VLRIRRGGSSIWAACGAGATPNACTCMYNKTVRTTIEVKPEHRARLLELAARRGEKGFSSVIAEALDAYLADRTGKERLCARALKLRGSLPAAEAERLRRDTAALRKVWR